MNPSPPQPKEAPPLLALFLLTAGLACVATGWWLGQVDLPRLIENQIARANGSISGETANWLRQCHFGKIALGLGVALIVFGSLAYLQGGVLRRLLTRIASAKDHRDVTPPTTTFLQRWGVALFACGTVFIYFYPTLGSGYFRYDDFDLLFLAQAKPFWSSLWLPHGDHILPLTRVLANLGLKLFGVTAWPYNLWLLLCMCGVLLAGTKLLSELKASRAAQVVFVCLITFWSPWAEMMAGYYILSIFLLIALLGLAAIWCYFRWLKCGRSGYALAMGGCFLVAPMVDVSGFLVVATGGVFLGANLASSFRATGWRLWLDQHRTLLCWLVFATAICLACYGYVYGVLHPGLFLSMGGEGRRSFMRLAADVGYAFSTGLLVSMATPFIYARLPSFILSGLVGTVFLLWAIFSWWAWRSSEKTRRWAMAAMLGVVFGACLMVCLGRHNADTVVVRWAAKHVGPAYIWLCVLITLGWDSLWQKLKPPQRTIFAELTLISLGLFVVAQNACGLLGMAVAFPPFGYPAEIRDAGRRRAAVEQLRTAVIGQSARTAHGAAIIPTLDGNFINAIYPSLFIYNLSRYRPFFTDELSAQVQLVRNSAMQPMPGDGLASVPVLREAVTPDFLKALREDTALRTFYAAETPLMAQTKSESSFDQINGVITESDGTTEIVLKAEAWDPESLPRLRIAAHSLSDSPATNIPVTVIFWSDCLNAEWRGTLILQSGPNNVTEVDLRQVYAFSLSQRVQNLRLILTKPGRYRFRLANLVP